MCKFHKLTVDWANCCSMWVLSCKCACDCDVHSCGGGLFRISASSEGKPPLLGPPPPTSLFPSLVPLCFPSFSLPLPTYSPSSLSNLFVLFPGRSLPSPCPLLFPFGWSCRSPSFALLPFPFSFSFLPFFTFESFPLFSLSRSLPRSIWQPNGQTEKEGGGTVGGFAIFLLSLSSVCVSVLAYVSSLPLSYVASKAAASDVR